MPDFESALPSQENSPTLLRVVSDKLPLLTLVIGGLSFGLLPILPFYLIVSALCILVRRRHGNRTWRSEWPFLIEIAGVGVSMATGSALWFQLLMSITIVAGTIAYLVFKRKIADALEVALLGKASAESGKHFLVASIIFLNILAALNLWVALRFSETTWLLFRALIPLLGAAPGLLRLVNFRQPAGSAPNEPPSSTDPRLEQ